MCWSVRSLIAVGLGDVGLDGGCHCGCHAVVLQIELEVGRFGERSLLSGVAEEENWRKISGTHIVGQSRS